MEKYLTTKEACEILGIKEVSTLYRYIQSGSLKAKKLGGKNSRRHWRIKESDLQAFIDSGNTGAVHAGHTEEITSLD